MKKIVCYLSLTFLCTTSIGCFNYTIYGNTEKQILNYIKTFKTYVEDGDSDFKIVDTMYLEDTKIVAFLSETHYGILSYKKDSNDNYTYRQIVAFGDNYSTDSGLSISRIFYNPYADFETCDIGWLVFSYGTYATKIEITINDTYCLSSNLDINTPSLILIPEDIPRSESKSIKIDYKYYDIGNNECSI